VLTVYVKKQLKDFSLNISISLSQKNFVIRGSSGAGKTTLLRCIAGLEKVDEGFISVGESVYLDTQKKIDVSPADRGIGFAFQDYLLFPHLNVEQNIMYGLRCQKNNNGSHKQEAKMFNDVVTGLELSYGYLPRYPQELSGGERQRVSLARALLAGNRLFLLDEPFNAIDRDCCGRLLDFVSHWIKEQNLASITVSHTEHDLFHSGKIVLDLEKGQVVSLSNERCI